jgi:hypothetical protein
MNINSQFLENDRPNAIKVMGLALDHIFEQYVEPNIDQADKEEHFRIAKLSLILQDIAEKAEAYYQLQEKGYEKNPNSLN